LQIRVFYKREEEVGSRNLEIELIFLDIEVNRHLINAWKA